MIFAPPRWSHEWTALARAAALVRDARVGREDHAAWAAIAADWHRAITHETTAGEPVAPEERIAALRAARDRAATAVAKAGANERADRSEKLELLETLLWHETEIRAGIPMIAMVTDINIAASRPARAHLTPLALLQPVLPAAANDHPAAPPSAPPLSATPRPTRTGQLGLFT